MVKESGVIGLCHWVRRFCILSVILLSLSFIFNWWHVFDTRETNIIALNIPVNFEYVKGFQWGLAILLSFIPLLLTIIAIGHVYRLMSLFLQSEFFSVETRHNLHQFSLWLLISAISKVVCNSLISMVLTMNNPSRGVIAVGLNSNTISTLFIVSVFFVITRIIKEGIKLTEENAEFI